MAFVACASAPTASTAKGPDPNALVEVKRGELDRLRGLEGALAAEKARVAELERALADARDALLVAEQRLGRAPFSPTTLVRADFTLKLPDADKLDAPGGRGKKTNLGRALGGTRRGALVAFWATWCKPCTTPDELQRLERLKRELADQGVDLVFFSVDETLAVVTGDARASGWLYPLWQRDNGHLEMLPRSWVQSQGVELPLMLVVSPDGKVSWARKGALDDLSMRDLLTAVMRAR